MQLRRVILPVCLASLMGCATATLRTQSRAQPAPTVGVVLQSASQQPHRGLSPDVARHPTRTNASNRESFIATSEAITQPIAARIIGHSWRSGCPVVIGQLRYLRLSYWGFDSVPRVGELIVHEDAAAQIRAIFHRLFAAHFPIARMQLVDDFGASDDRSTMANNTSAFNCRQITGGGSWSQHSYGRAIDINPVQNPYVSHDGHVLDSAAVPYLNRSQNLPGMIVPGDVATTAFASFGWGWGGNFNSFKDYQHFSANGS